MALSIGIRLKQLAKLQAHPMNTMKMILLHPTTSLFDNKIESAMGLLSKIIEGSLIDLPLQTLIRAHIETTPEIS